MTQVKYLTEEALIKKTINLLMSELGPVDAIRFTNLIKGKRADSVKRHRDWQKMLDKGKFIDEVFHR